jgi:hypothetical protein
MILILFVALAGIIYLQTHAPPVVSNTITVLVVIYFVYQWISSKKKRKV